MELLQAERDVGTLTLDLVLRAQASLAAAEGAYYQQLVAYSKALTAFHLSTGKLLDHNGVYLAEGPWCSDARCDATLRAHARTHAKDAPRLSSEPYEFVSPGPAGSVELQPSNTSEIEPTLITPSMLESTEEKSEASALTPQPQSKTETNGPSKEDRIINGQSVLPSRSSGLLDDLVPERLHLYDRKPTRSASAESDFPSLITR